jgi:hypothetical protein
MQHIPSTVEVFFTAEYGLFKMINGNRQLDERKISKIIRDISDGIDVLKYYPIQVSEKNGRLEIIDGQHRFFISKKLKRPVYYIILKEERQLTDIAKINSNTEKWKVKDFINCYIQQGNPNYQMLQDFMDKYSFSSTLAIKLLQLGNPGTESGLLSIHQTFQRGEFEVTFLQDAVDIAELCKLFEPFPHWRDRGFVIAIYRISQAQKINIPDLAARVQKNPERLTRQSGFKEYIFLLEQIYNIGKQQRVIIY